MTELATMPAPSRQGLSMSGPLQNAETCRKLLIDSKDRIESIMPKTAAMRFERFLRQAMIAVSKTPKLLNCTRTSFLAAIIEAANLGLDPSGGALGEAYLIPYGDEAKLMPGYRGLCNLARRAGTVQDIWCDVVYEGDLFREMKGSEHRIIHESGGGPRNDDNIIGAYVCANLGNGVVHPHYVDRAYIDKCRRVSKTSRRDDSPWLLWFPQMCMKTACRSGIKMLPISSEDISRAIELADQEFDFDGQQERPETPAKGVNATMERIATRRSPARQPEPPVDTDFTDLANHPDPPATAGDTTTPPEDAGGEGTKTERPLDEDSPATINAALSKPWPQVVEFLWATAEKQAFVPEREAFDKWLHIKVKVGAGKLGKEGEIKLTHKQAWCREIADGKAFKA